MEYIDPLVFKVIAELFGALFSKWPLSLTSNNSATVVSYRYGGKFGLVVFKVILESFGAHYSMAWNTKTTGCRANGVNTNNKYMEYIWPCSVQCHIEVIRCNSEM